MLFKYVLYTKTAKITTWHIIMKDNLVKVIHLTYGEYNFIIAHMVHRINRSISE